MDAADFLTADFQRVNISGEDSSGVPVEDLHSAAELLTKALNIRQKYCRLSYQEFPANVERCNHSELLLFFYYLLRFLGMMNGKPVTEPDTIVSKATIAGIVKTVF